MGTHHWWRVLLLGAALVGSTLAGGPDPCAANRPKSECSAVAVAGCKEIDDGQPLKCTEHRKLHLELAKGSGQLTHDYVGEEATCDSVSKKYTAKGIGATGDANLEATSNVVCAPVCSNTCDVSKLKVQAHCKAADGCKVDADPDVTPGPCQAAKCQATSLGFAHKTPDDLIQEIKCSNGKWFDTESGEPVDEAVCVQKYECHKKPNQPKTDCTHDEYDFDGTGCVPGQISFANDMDKKCGSPKNMYFLGNNDWIEDTNNEIKCDKNGFWEINISPLTSTSDRLGSDGHVICASKKPEKLKTCKDAVLITPDVTTLDGNCAPVTLPTTGEVKCTGSQKLYIKLAGGSWQLAEKIACNRGTGKWDHGEATTAELDPSTAVVCADTIPTPKAHPGCAVISWDGNCPTTVPTGVTCQNLLAVSSPVTCVSPSKLYVDIGDDGSWAEYDRLECDSQGKWTAVKAATKDAVVRTDKAVCATGDLANPCVMKMQISDRVGFNLAPANYEQVTKTQTSGEIQCSNGLLKLYVERGGVWALAMKVTCNAKSGLWMEALATPAEVGAAEKVICADTLPVPRTPGCQSGSNPLTDGCSTSSFSSDPTIGCTPTNFFVDQLDCSPKHLYYKDSGSSIWEELSATTKITCDWQNTGKWTGVTAIDTGSADVICANKNPTADGTYCQAGANKLDSKCPAEKSDCTPITSFDNGVKCADPTPTIFFTHNAAGGVWTETTKVECDVQNKEWKQGDGAAATVLTAEPNVVCAKSSPGVMCKNTQPTLACPASTDAKPVPPEYNCANTVISAANGDAMDACAASGKRFILKAGAWEDASTIVCDPDGTWKLPSLTPPYTVQSTDVVICADRNPSLPVPSTCSTPLTPSCDGNGLPTATCTQPTGLSTELSCATGNLYFKKDATVKFYMKAESIACTPANAWEVKYKFGRDWKNETLKPEAAQITCDDANPTPIACSLSELGVDRNKYDKRAPAKINYEAGEVANCDGNHFVVPEGSSSVLASTISSAQPMCNPIDGKWVAEDEEGKLVAFGDKLGCAIDNCKLCTDKFNKEVNPFDFGHSLFASEQKFVKSSCNYYECVHKTVAVKTDGKLNYYTKRLECSSDSRWLVEGIEAKKIQCTQQWNCLNNFKIAAWGYKFPQVSLDCPADIAPEFNCESPISSTMDTSTPDDTLKCNNNKKLFAKKHSSEWWKEVAGPELTCDKQEGTWKLNGEKDGRDYKHTIVCADSNPKPEPTTTTPTITTTTPMPICDLCRKNLPNFETCDTCVDQNSTGVIKMDPQRTEDKDKCILILDKAGYILLVNQTVQHKLVCERDGKWRTESGQLIEKNQIKAQKEAKKGEWQPASYGILAAAIIGIGGMAVGCVAIYMRMRKKVSEREPKKKERGVTKKYTASNVMRTGGRSKGGSKESGKSREPTASKMEENIEDAPTLKL